MNINIDEIKKSSVLWKLLDTKVQHCAKQMVEYIRDIKRIWASHEKEQSEGKIY